RGGAAGGHPGGPQARGRRTRFRGGAAAGGPAARPGREIRSGPRAPPPPLVLVVDDETPIRRFLKAALDGNGYRVLEAETARDALREAATRSPDLVLLDLGLPDLDGVEVTRRLREWSGVPIVVVSARGQERDKIAALD